MPWCVFGAPQCAFRTVLSRPPAEKMNVRPQHHSKLKSIARSPRHYYLLHKGQLKTRVTRPISVQQVLVMPLWHSPRAQLLSTTTTHAATTHSEDRTSDGAPHHLSRAQTRQRNRSVIISHKARALAAKTKLARAQAGTLSFDRRE